MSKSEMSQYLGLFLDEGHEQLELLENSIVALERTSDPDADLQILFRAAHTLKGSSRAMGFTSIGDLTHDMENVLDSLRNHQLELSTAVIDCLLDCLDALKGLMNGVAETGKDAGEADGVQGLVSRLNALRTQQPAEPKAPVAAESTPADIGANSIRVTLAESCPMKGVRAFLVIGEVASMATIVSTDPDQSVLDEDNFGNAFSIAVETDGTLEEICEKVRALPDVAAAEWQPVVAENPVEAPKLEVVESTTPAQAPASQTVRVDVARLDKLLNLVGELVTDRTQLATIAHGIKESVQENEHVGALIEAITRVGRVTSELQEEIMKSRMLPINGVFQRMPRMVRDIAQKIGKDIEFEMSGGETELDRSVLETLADPLIHLLRNAVDHGVETPKERKAAGKDPRGHVLLSARHERSQIVVDIEDDGNGIDPSVMRAAGVRKGLISEAAADSMSDRDALYLVFAAGLSTAKEVSDVSGRGVGMDIVKSNIEKIGGRVTVESKVGQGSRFRIYLPLTLAIVRALLVSAEGATYALPLTSVTEMISLHSSTEELTQCTTGGQAAIMLRGETMPLANLADVLRGDRRAVDPKRMDGNAHAVIVRHGDGHTALAVDSLQGELEVVIKPLGSYLGDIPGVSGASILGDGRVALIVDASKALEEIYRAASTAA